MDRLHNPIMYHGHEWMDRRMDKPKIIELHQRMFVGGTVTNLRPHPLNSLCMKFEFNWSSGFREDFKNVDRWTMDRRLMLESLLYYLLT